MVHVCANLHGCLYYHRIVYCLGLLNVAYEHTLLSWQWLGRVQNVCKVSLSYVLVYHSYGAECVIIICGHLTKIQGCHGNCSGGLYVYAEYHS